MSAPAFAHTALQGPPDGEPITTCTMRRTDEDPTVKPASKGKSQGQGERYFNQAYDAAMKIGVGVKSDDGEEVMTGISAMIVRMEFVKLYPADSHEVSKRAWNRALLKMCDDVEGDYHHRDSVIYRGKPNS